MTQLGISLANAAIAQAHRPPHAASTGDMARFALPVSGGTTTVSSTHSSAQFSAAISAPADEKPVDSEPATVPTLPVEIQTGDQPALSPMPVSTSTADPAKSLQAIRTQTQAKQSIAADTRTVQTSDAGSAASFGIGTPDHYTKTKPEYAAVTGTMPPDRASTISAKSDNISSRSAPLFDVTLQSNAALPSATISTTIPAAPFGILNPAVSNRETITLSSIDTGQAVIQRTLDTARGDLWLTGLASDIAASRQSNGRLSFTMQPENLGMLAVDISADDAGMSLKMTASSNEAAQLIAAGHTKLADELRAQNIRISETDIQTRSDASSHDTGQHDASKDAARPNAGRTDDRAATDDDEPHNETGEDRAAMQHGRFA